MRELPEGAESHYEVKWDGYRVRVLKDSETVLVPESNAAAIVKN